MKIKTIEQSVDLFINPFNLLGGGGYIDSGKCYLLKTRGFYQFPEGVAK